MERNCVMDSRPHLMDKSTKSSAAAALAKRFAQAFPPLLPLSSPPLERPARSPVSCTSNSQGDVLPWKQATMQFGLQMQGSLTTPHPARIAPQSQLLPSTGYPKTTPYTVALTSRMSNPTPKHDTRQQANGITSHKSNL